MNNITLWNKKKSSGSFRRKVLKNRKLLLDEINANTAKGDSVNPVAVRIDEQCIVAENIEPFLNESPTLDLPVTELDKEIDENPKETDSDELDGDELDGDEYLFSNLDGNEDDAFDDFLRKWAIMFNIRQCALKVLLKKLNRTFGAKLPENPRYLMRMCARCTN